MGCKPLSFSLNHGINHVAFPRSREAHDSSGLLVVLESSSNLHMVAVILFLDKTSPYG